MQQFLQGTTVVQTAAYFGHKLFGNVKGKPAPLQATVEDVAGVLFPRKTGAAVFAHTQGLRRRLREPSAAGQRVSACSRNQALDIRRGFAFRPHDVWMSHNIHTCQEKK